MKDLSIYEVWNPMTCQSRFYNNFYNAYIAWGKTQAALPSCVSAHIFQYKLHITTGEYVIDEDNLAFTQMPIWSS